MGRTVYQYTYIRVFRATVFAVNTPRRVHRHTGTPNKMSETNERTRHSERNTQYVRKLSFRRIYGVEFVRKKHKKKNNKKPFYNVRVRIPCACVRTVASAGFGEGSGAQKLIIAINVHGIKSVGRCILGSD